VLTSLSEEAMSEIGVAGGLTAQVEALAALAQTAGPPDGVVALSAGNRIIRKRCGASFQIVDAGNSQRVG